MKKIMQSWFTLLLAITMVINMFAMPAAAADYACKDYADCTADGAQIYSVIKSGAEIKCEAKKKGKVYAKAEKNTLISVKRTFNTDRATKWVEIRLSNGKSVYTLAENVKKHTHSFTTVVKNKKGTIGYCVCGFAKATAGKKSTTCDLSCHVDQAVKGSFSDYDPTFTSVVAQIIVAEIGGPIADARDLAGDILKGESAAVLALDMVGFIPLFGVIKFADEAAVLGKNADTISKVVKNDWRLGPSTSFLQGLPALNMKVDSTLLAKNMNMVYEISGLDRFDDMSYVAVGIKKDKVAAHHIVSGYGRSKYATGSQNILYAVGIDINDARNGVYLPTPQATAKKGTIHSGPHSEYYHKQVYEKLVNAINSVGDGTIEDYREAVVIALDEIAQDLMSGDMALNMAS